MTAGRVARGRRFCGRWDDGLGGRRRPRAVWAGDERLDAVCVTLLGQGDKVALLWLGRNPKSAGRQGIMVRGGRAGLSKVRWAASLEA